MKKSTIKKIFPLFSILTMAIYFIWAFLFVQNIEFDLPTFQILLFGFWGTITLLITLHEYFFTKKVILSVFIVLITLISGPLPLINFVIMLLAYYFTFKNLAKIRKDPKTYGGFSMSLFALGLITITLIKGIQGLYIYYTVLA